MVISDNIESALFLVKIFIKTKYKLIIGGSVFPEKLFKLINKHNNIHFENIIDDKKLEVLLQKAHINILWSFQESGTKLKVFNSLFKGRHCIINKNIVDESEIQSLCHIANNEKEILKALEKLFKIEFTLENNRKEILLDYTANKSIKKLVAIINQ